VFEIITLQAAEAASIPVKKKMENGKILKTYYVK
jgi:hypothetical protein